MQLIIFYNLKLIYLKMTHVLFSLSRKLAAGAGMAAGVAFS